MSRRSIDVYEKPVTPEDVRAAIDEAGPDGFIEIRFFDSRGTVMQEAGPAHIGFIDEGGIEIKTMFRECVLSLDDIEWVKPYKGNPDRVET